MSALKEDGADDTDEETLATVKT